MYFVFLLAGCSDSEKVEEALGERPVLSDVLVTNYDDGLVPIGDIDTHPLLQTHFSWYTHLLSPDGEPVMILAQSGASSAQIIRLRELLQFGLNPRDLSGTQDIDLVFDAVADNKAALLLFDNDSQRSAATSDGVFELDWWAFSVLNSENVLPGSESWMTNEPPDLAFAICFDMIFQTGWGEVDAELQSNLLSLSNEAIDEGFWLPNSSVQEGWTAGQQAAVYFSQLVSIDFGYWQHSDAPWDAQWTLNSRASISASHPDASAQLRAIVPEYYDLPIVLEPELSESLSLNDDGVSPWNAKSQYYVDVTLSGNSDIDLIGNAQDNVLAGNAGSNRLIGGDGIDTVRFQGPISEYDIQSSANGYILFDEDLDRDGADEIIEFEFVEFSDGVVEIEALLSR